MAVFHNTVIVGAAGAAAGGAGDYKIEQSLRLNSADESKLTKTPSTGGNTKTWTLSWWMKAPEVDATIFSSGDASQNRFGFGTNGNGAFFAFVIDSNSTVFSITTDAYFRDPSAWYHCCLVCDSTAATQADRFKIIVNGVRQTVTGTLMPDNQNTHVNTTQNHQWSGRSYTGVDFADGYIADIHFVDGSAIDPAGKFGKFVEGIWNPIKYTGAYNGAAISGTSYSSTSTISGAAGMFDGNTNNYVSSAMDGTYETVTTAPITFTQNNGAFTYTTNNCGSTGGSNYRYLRLTRQSDGQTTELSENSCNGWSIPNAWTGITISKIEWKRWSSSENVSAVYVDGTMLVDSGAPAGVNGYHLDFSDTRNNSTLGDDRTRPDYDKLSGALTTTSGSGSFYGGPVSNAFDGKTNTNVLGGWENSGDTSNLIWSPPSGSYSVSSSLRVYAGYYSTISVNGVSKATGGHGDNSTWITLSHTGAINEIKLENATNDNVVRLHAIEIDGTVVVSNAWTVTNITGALPTPPFSWDGGTLNLSATGGSGNAGGYKDAYFQLPATGSHSWDILINTDGNTGFWFSDSSSASNTHPNQQSGNFIGLRNNGGGSAATGGSGFGSGTVSMPTDAMDGDPRWYFTIDRSAGSGTVKAGTGSAYTFDIPSSGDLYFHVNAYGAYEFNLSSGVASDVDVLIDSPTSFEAESGNNVGNYATWNALTKRGSVTTSNGNLEANTTNSGLGYVLSTIPISSGKFYCEIAFAGEMSHNTNYMYIGIVPTSSAAAHNGNDIFRATGALSIDSNSSVIRGTIGTGSGDTNNTYQSSYGFDENDVIGIAIDCDTPQVTFYKNGTSIGTFPHAMESGKSWVVFVNDWANGADITKYILNTGQREFKHTPPTNFKAYCTTNLGDPLIANSSAYFDVKTYAGAAAPAAALPSTSLNTSTAYRHHRILCEGDNNGGSISEVQFFDASGLIDASDTNNSGGSISSNNNQVGASDGLAAWTAFNGTLGGAGYANGVRKDPSSGFYIAKDWGSGVTKTVTGVKIWGVNGYAIAGNTSSTYIKLQGSNDGSSWTDLQTFDDSRTSSWTSSSSTEVAHTTDFPTEITGYEFSPDLVWIKKRSGTSDHALFDTVRGPNKRLYPNNNSGEDSPTNNLTSFDSTGFKLGSSNDVNQNGQTYAAWAWEGGELYTSSAYQQSQTWSNLVTGTLETTYGNSSAAAPFDGDTGSNYSDGIRPTSGNYLSMNFGTTFANATSVKIYGHASLDGATYAGANENLKINGTAIGASDWANNGGSAGQSSATFSLSSGLTSVEWGYSSGSQSTGYLYFQGIEVDGKLLIDPGVIPPGALNSSAYDQSRTWSTYGSFNNHHGSGYEWDDVFNTNNIYNDAGSLFVPANQVDTWTLTSGVAVATSVKVYTYSSTTVTINSGESDETSVTGTLSAFGYVEVPFSGTVTKVSLSGASGGSIYVMGIWFDGKRLVDDTETPANVPSIPATVKAQATSGLSIVTWTGTNAAGSLGHGLGKKPELIIVKVYGDNTYSDNWPVYHPAYGAGSYTYLNLPTAAPASYTGFFNGVEPDSSVFTVGDANSDNGKKLIAYCFTSVEGYSSVGSFYGGSDTVVTTGFAPKFVLLKRSDASAHWYMFDSERGPINPNETWIEANNTTGDQTHANGQVLFLSNGFQAKGGDVDASGTYIYIAFGDPFKTQRAR